VADQRGGWAAVSRAARFRRTRPASAGDTAPPVEPGPPAPTSTRRPKRRRWAMPGSPAERVAEPVDPPPAELHPCPHCRERHQPIRMGGGGLAAAYARPLLPDPYASRPGPLGRSSDADVSSLARDSAGAWAWGHRRPLVPEPPPSGLVDRIRSWWQGDQEPTGR
jgi:hypothetical protein